MDCTLQNGINPGLIGAIYLALVLFGIGYNWLTAKAESTRFIRGYTSLFVAGGVAVTVATMGFVSLHFAILTAGAFVASGVPMIIGEMIRHKRREALRRARKVARHHGYPS